MVSTVGRHGSLPVRMVERAYATDASDPVVYLNLSPVQPGSWCRGVCYQMLITYFDDGA